MRPPLSERPHILAALSLILLCALILGLQGRKAKRSGVMPPSASAALTLLSPLQVGIKGTFKALGRYAWALFHLRHLLRENEELRRRLKEAEVRNARLTEYFFENKRLLKLLEMKPRLSPRAIAARVLARNPSNWSQALIVDRGSRDGVKVGFAAVAPGGLVGRVYQVGRRFSKVMLITDRQSGVGAIVQRSREPGIVCGTGGPICVMKYLDRNADVRHADVVITSGIGSLFPSGIPIGKVLRVRQDPEQPLLQALVQPFVNLNKVEELFLIPSPEE